MFENNRRVPLFFILTIVISLAISVPIFANDGLTEREIAAIEFTRELMAELRQMSFETAEQGERFISSRLREWHQSDFGASYRTTNADSAWADNHIMTWNNANPNFEVPATSHYRRVANGVIMEGALQVDWRNTMHLGDGSWLHVVSYSGWISRSGDNSL